jgi:quinol monooxygenase YgiN
VAGGNFRDRQQFGRVMTDLRNLTAPLRNRPTCRLFNVWKKMDAFEEFLGSDEFRRLKEALGIETIAKVIAKEEDANVAHAKLKSILRSRKKKNAKSQKTE